MSKIVCYSVTLTAGDLHVGNPEGAGAFLGVVQLQPPGTPASHICAFCSQKCSVIFVFSAPQKWGNVTLWVQAHEWFTSHLFTEGLGVLSESFEGREPSF
jgi:hypothetical protein